MATKFVHDSVMDALLAKVKTSAAKMTVCKSDPTTYSQAITSYKLADVSVSDSDFTIADSGTGRKMTTGAQNSISVDSTGSAEAVCVVDASKILIKTTCTKQALTKGNKVNIPAFV